MQTHMRRRIIALFGNSAPRPGEPQYELAREIGGALARAGFDLINGGHEGVMEAAGRGARENGARVIGVTCRAVRETRGAVINPFVHETVETDSLFERIRLMMIRASGYVIMDGGTGTLAELGMVWEHISKKHINARPIVCVGPFWRPVIDAVSLTRPEAATYVHFVETAEAVAGLLLQEAADVGQEPDVELEADMRHRGAFAPRGALEVGGPGADATTTVNDLKQLMYDFVSARDWHQFHDAKNLSASIAIEAAELMEHFQWVHSDALSAIRDDAAQVAEIREEVADVLAYLLSFASTMGIDLTTALSAKMLKNDAKYPVDRYYGTFRAKSMDRGKPNS
jgi:uncharacterized protein (TIGR00730 family)